MGDKKMQTNVVTFNSEIHDVFAYYEILDFRLILLSSFVSVMLSKYKQKRRRKNTKHDRNWSA